MKKISKKFPLVILAMVLSIFLAVGVVGMGNALAADCGDTTGNGSTDTICACGDTVVGASGYTYTLTGNLNCPDPNPNLGTDHGLTVGATDITIDGVDYYINGVDGRQCVAGETNDAGIKSVGHSGVTIMNLKVKNFCHGIEMQGAGSTHATDNTIQDCTIHDNGDSTEGSQTHGIKWNRVSESFIKKCTIYNQGGDSGASGPPGGFGIYLCSGDDNEWSYNEIYDTLAGMFLRCSPWRAWLHHNTLHDNPFGGIRCQCINDREFLVEHNHCHHNVGGGSGEWNGGYGIFFGGADDLPGTVPNKAQYNVCEDNRVGISFERNAWIGELYENTSCNNTDWDIYVQDGAVVTGNYNTCDTYYNYNDQGTIGCTYACTCPMAKFYADSTIICAGDDVQFTDLSLADPDITGCAITSWSWDVDGDGSEDYNTQNPIHAYSDSGIYDVSLTVTQTGGTCSGSDSKTRSGYISVCPYKGDFDSDADVDGTDMHKFYTDCLQESPPPAWCDVNGDGSINASDMNNVGRSDCAYCP